MLVVGTGIGWPGSASISCGHVAVRGGCEIVVAKEELDGAGLTVEGDR
ncbi:hypothetical protein [Micromonospora sp. RTP1Z1]|nr:hypothetical protein [Micromonospora sp. RTP1Z1]